MESLICENPLDICYHYRHNAAFDGIVVADKHFCSKYVPVADKLKEGMKICSQCRTMIENSFLNLTKHEEPLGHQQCSAKMAETSRPTVVKTKEYCCNPFKRKLHVAGKNSGKVTQKMAQKFSSDLVKICVGDKICSTCKIDLYRYMKNVNLPQINQPDDVSPNTIRSR